MDFPFVFVCSCVLPSTKESSTRMMPAQQVSGLTELCRLAEYHGTDKLHFYTPFYDLLFRDRREKIYKVLEIGIGTVHAMAHVPLYKPGASLRMWRDYFPNAMIFGIDKEEFPPMGASDALNIRQCDQSSEEQLTGIIPWLAAGGKFDLIVDDGSHNPTDQLLTFRILSRLLDSRGLYIIEDLQDGAYYDGLPDHSLVFHRSGNLVGKCILIRGEAIHG